MIACVWHVNDSMTSQNRPAFAGLVHRRSLFKWGLWSAFGLLWFIFQEVKTEHVRGMRLARRTVTSHDLVRDLNTELQISNGLRGAKSGGQHDEILGLQTSLTDFGEFERGTPLEKEFQDWIRQSKPKVTNDVEHATIYPRSELRGAWYIFLKSQHPEMYAKQLGKTSIIKAVEVQADRQVAPERKLYDFLDQVFTTDETNSAPKFLIYLESIYGGRLDHSKFYDISRLYEKLLDWLNETEDAKSLNDFPKREYYAQWDKLLGRFGDTNILMNKEIYPLVNESWQKEQLKAFLPKGYLESPISAGQFLDFLKGKILRIEMNEFMDWFEEKHSLGKEEQLMEKTIPRQDLAINFVKWVNERPYYPNEDLKTYKLNEIIKNHGPKAATKSLLKEINSEIPGFPEEFLDQSKDMEMGKLTAGKKMRLKDMVDSRKIKLSDSESEKFMNHIFQSPEFEQEREDLRKGKVWNDEDLENVYQKWQNSSKKPNDLEKSAQTAENHVKNENSTKNVEGSDTSWESFKKGFKNYARRHWYKMKKFYNKIKDWLKNIFQPPTKGDQPLNKAHSQKPLDHVN